LVAFLSVIGLLAFRTQKVPELVFGLAKDKLTKERFAQIVNRFMVYGLVVFFLLTGVAVAGQVLAYKTQARALSLDDLRKEMRQLEGTEEQKKAALEAYSKSLALLDRREFNQAIESLQASIQASPSVTAQYTLAYLYQKLGKRQEANQSAAAAQSLATLRNDALASLRLGRLGNDAPSRRQPQLR
jgi:tetratricopeptide (TPR) repeat protein